MATQEVVWVPPVPPPTGPPELESAPPVSSATSHSGQPPPPPPLPLLSLPPPVPPLPLYKPTLDSRSFVLYSQPMAASGVLPGSSTYPHPPPALPIQLPTVAFPPPLYTPAMSTHKFTTRFTSYGPDDFAKAERKQSPSAASGGGKRRRLDSTTTAGKSSGRGTTPLQPYESIMTPFEPPPLVAAIPTASAPPFRPPTSAAPQLPPSDAPKRPGWLGRKITPVTRDVPVELAEQPLDHLYQEITEPVPSAAPSSMPPPATVKYLCVICEHSFPKKHTVLTHIKTHLGKKAYACTHEGCDMSFVREHDRRRHELTHTGIRPFSCPCGKEFSRQDALRRHSTFGKCSLRDPALLEAKDDPPEEGEVVAAVEPVSPMIKREVSEPEDDAKAVPTPKAPSRAKGRPKGTTKVTSATRSKKKKSGAFSRPVRAGDSDLDEEDVTPSPVVTKSRGRASVSKSTPPVEKEPQDPNVIYETDDPEAPSSFLFFIPGLHSPPAPPSAPLSTAMEVDSLTPSGSRASRSPSPIPSVVASEPVEEVQEHEDPYASISERLHSKSSLPAFLIGSSDSSEEELPAFIFNLQPLSADDDVDEDMWDDSDSDTPGPSTPYHGQSNLGSPTVAKAISTCNSPWTTTKPTQDSPALCI